VAKKIKTWGDLRRVLKRDIGLIIQDELKNIGDEIKKALKQELKSKWYGRSGYSSESFSTDSYDRTFELLESITLSPTSIKGNQFSVRIYYDTDKMNTYDSENGMLSKHKSHISGEDSRVMLPYWIEEGTSGSPIYNMPRTNVVGDLKDRLIDDKALLQHFESALKKRGYDVIVG
jgi:hypothetical protein